MANIIHIGGGANGDAGYITYGDTLFVADSVEPTNKTILWIDTSNNNLMKYYDVKTQEWIPISAAWG